MIELYTSKKAVQKNNNYIESIDLEFDKQIYTLNITNKDKEYMKNIDEAYYNGNGYIITPFGRTEIQNLSTGCKTLILLNHLKELGNPIVNINECGRNVLDIVFDMNNIRVMLDFCNMPYNYEPEKEIEVVTTKSRNRLTLRTVFEKVWAKR